MKSPNHRKESLDRISQLFRTTTGECGITIGPHSTKLPQSWVTESDQLGAPRIYGVQISSENVSLDRLPQYSIKISSPDGKTKL